MNLQVVKTVYFFRQIQTQAEKTLGIATPQQIDVSEAIRISLPILG
jgi:hypothetical protein